MTLSLGWCNISTAFGSSETFVKSVHMRIRLHLFAFDLVAFVVALSLPSVSLSAPLTDGRYTGTIRFVQSAPAGCPADVCTRSISTSFTLKKKGKKKFTLRQPRLTATLSKDKNGVFSGYAGTARAGACLLDIFPGVKALPDKGFILAAFVFRFRCEAGNLSAFYSGRVRKR